MKIQVQRMATIRDAVLNPFEVDCTENTYRVMKTQGGKRTQMSFHTELSDAMMQVVKLKAAETDKVYTIREYIEALNKFRKQFEKIFELMHV